jgi:hypothetical protein
MEFPKHEAGLSLTHNEHHTYYETVEQYIFNREAVGPLDWVDDTHRARAIAEDSLWILQWYPNTPVGFNQIAGADLDSVMRAVQAQEGGLDR